MGNQNFLRHVNRQEAGSNKRPPKKRFATTASLPRRRKPADFGLSPRGDRPSDRKMVKPGRSDRTPEIIRPLVDADPDPVGAASQVVFRQSENVKQEALVLPRHIVNFGLISNG